MVESTIDVYRRVGEWWWRDQEMRPVLKIQQSKVYSTKTKEFQCV